MRDHARKLAIEFEQAERARYLEAAVKVEDLRAARLFTALALEELEHQLEWEELLPRPTPDSTAGQVDSPVSTILRELLPRSSELAPAHPLTWSSGDLAVLESAAASERRGLELYDQLLGANPVNDDRVFLAALKMQESGHLTALQTLCHRE